MTESERWWIQERDGAVALTNGGGGGGQVGETEG